MKEFVKKIVAVLLVLTTLFNTGAYDVYADDTLECKDEMCSKVEEIEQFIELIDPYVDVQEEQEGVNVLVVDIPEEIKESVDNEMLVAIEKNVEEINYEAINEEIIITDNGTIHEMEDDEFVIQGGNIDKFKKYWWGCRRWACRNCAQDIQDGFNKISTGCWGVSAVGGLITLTPVAAVGVGVSLGGAYTAVMYGWIATDIGTVLRKNPKNGVVISLYSSMVYSVKSQ